MRKLAPMVRGRKGTHQGVLDEIQKSGFVRARVDGTRCMSVIKIQGMAQIAVEQRC